MTSSSSISSLVEISRSLSSRISIIALSAEPSQIHALYLANSIGRLLFKSCSCTFLQPHICFIPLNNGNPSAVIRRSFISTSRFINAFRADNLSFELSISLFFIFTNRKYVFILIPYLTPLLLITIS